MESAIIPEYRSCAAFFEILICALFKPKAINSQAAVAAGSMAHIVSTSTWWSIRMDSLAIVNLLSSTRAAFDVSVIMAKLFSIRASSTISISSTMDGFCLSKDPKAYTFLLG